MRKSLDKHEEFSLMAEVMVDLYSQFFDCVHGGFGGDKAERLRLLNSDTPTCVAAPEMYRHTFPETMSTHRIPRPHMDPGYINACLCYGAKYEMEVRYLHDREYIESDHNPEWKKYASDVTAFRQKYAHLLLWGMYACDWTLAKENLLLKHGIFKNGEESCLVLWNDTKESVPLKLSKTDYVRWETLYDSGDGIPEFVAPESFVVLF